MKRAGTQSEAEVKVGAASAGAQGPDWKPGGQEGVVLVRQVDRPKGR